MAIILEPSSAQDKAGELAEFCRRVSALGSTGRYFEPHAPLMFLVLALHQKPEFFLQDVVALYRELARPAEQWPPLPRTGWMRLYRRGILCLLDENGRTLPRTSLTRASQATPLKARLHPALGGLLATPETRPMILASVFFSFCEEQKEGLAVKNRELASLLARRETWEGFSDLEPEQEDTATWTRIESPGVLPSLKDYEAFLVESLRRNRPYLRLLGQLPLSSQAYSRIERLLQSHAKDATAYPVTLALYLVWTGILKYNVDFWPQIPHGPRYQGDWGPQFMATLARYDFPVFDDVGGYRYLTPILAHGGVPDSCLPDFFHNLIIPLADGQFGAHTSVELVREWRQDHEMIKFWYRPSSRFLDRGGHAAEDFVERCRQMVEQYFESNTVLPPEALGLPEHVVKWFQSFLEENHEDDPLTSHNRLRAPFFQIQPGSRVVLTLPAQRLVLNAADRNIPSVVWSMAGRTLEARLHDRGAFFETDRESIPWEDPGRGETIRLLVGGNPERAWELKPFVPEGAEWVFADPASGRPWVDSLLPRGEIWILGKVQARGSGAEETVEFPTLLVKKRFWEFRGLDLTRLRGQLTVRGLEKSATYDCEPASAWLRAA